MTSVSLFLILADTLERSARHNLDAAAMSSRYSSFLMLSLNVSIYPIVDTTPWHQSVDQALSNTALLSFPLLVLLICCSDHHWFPDNHTGVALRVQSLPSSLNHFLIFVLWHHSPLP